ncbi:ribonuclease III [bacterium F11]|nr:ribonuclease III [bacterium F11]
MPSSSSKNTIQAESLSDFEKKARIRFKNPKFLKEAFTHKSYAIENGNIECNERLEFLGDSIISAAVATFLFKRYPDVNEGRLSKLKSQIVSRANLSQWAGEMNLGKYLLLSQGEEATGGRKRDSLLGNAYEAVVGALFLDQGYQKAEKFILGQLAKKKRIVETDFKSRLQEIVQKKFKTPPTYIVIDETGPDHAKHFTLEVRIQKKILGIGSGKSKKEAEQCAAKEALTNIRHNKTI